MKLYNLSPDELQALHKALTHADSPFGLRRLIAKVPEERLRFSLEAFEVSGLLEIEVNDSTIRIIAPYALDKNCVVINRANAATTPEHPLATGPDTGEDAR